MGAHHVQLVIKRSRAAQIWWPMFLVTQFVVGGSTNVAFEIEQPLLAPLARMRFDTARREPRRVGRVPMIEWNTVFYSVPPEVANTVVEVRQPVAARVVEIRFAGRLVATHALVRPGSEPQWLVEHHRATEAIALGRHDRRLRCVRVDTARSAAVGLDLGNGDFDIEVPDLAVFDSIGPDPIINVGSFGSECSGDDR